MTRAQFDSIVNDQMVFLSNASQIRKNLEQTRKPYFGPPEIGIPLLHDFFKAAYPFIQVSVLIYCYNVTLSSCYARVTILTRVIWSTMELNSFSSSLLPVLRKTYSILLAIEVHCAGDFSGAHFASMLNRSKVTSVLQG